MMLAWVSAAWAGSVDAIECARAVTFTTPYAWNWSAERVPVRDATALLVRADAELLRPRDVGQAVLYVAGWPAEVLWTEGDAAWVLAPLALEARIPAWFGPDTLPERVDAAARKAATDAAAGLLPLEPKQAGTPLTWSATRNELVAELRRGCR
jgi:hypothetical protein